jgi:hypothetical protein
MKWRYTAIQHQPRIALGLTPNEYCVLDIIYKSQTHPRYGTDGWASVGCHKIASFMGCSSGTIHKMLERFEKWGLVEFSENRNLKRTTSNWFDIAYLENCESAEGVQLLNTVQKVNRGCSKSERLGVQKVNGNCSKSEPIYKEDKDKEEIKRLKVIDLKIEFEKFWNLYSKKVEKKKSFAKWKKLTSEEKKQIFAHVPGYVKSTPNETYRKNPLTYLNGECWNDEIILPKEKQTRLKVAKGADYDRKAAEAAKQQQLKVCVI